MMRNKNHRICKVAKVVRSVAVIPKTKNEMNDVMHVTLESISWGCSNRPDINNNC